MLGEILAITRTKRVVSLFKLKKTMSPASCLLRIYTNRSLVIKYLHHSKENGRGLAKLVRHSHHS